jgi:hypothetical protein
VDAHRPDELTPQRQRRDTITNDQLARQIDELEQELRRDDPSPAQQFNKLRRARTRVDITVFSLLAVAAVLLAISLATTSPIAGFAGIVAYVAAFGVYNQHLRKLDRRSAPHRRRAR